MSALRVLLSALAGFVGIFAVPRILRLIPAAGPYVVWDRDPDPNPWITNHFALCIAAEVLVCGLLAYWLSGRIGRLRD